MLQALRQKLWNCRDRETAKPSQAKMGLLKCPCAFYDQSCLKWHWQSIQHPYMVNNGPLGRAEWGSFLFLLFYQWWGAQESLHKITFIWRRQYSAGGLCFFNWKCWGMNLGAQKYCTTKLWSPSMPRHVSQLLPESIPVGACFNCPKVVHFIQKCLNFLLVLFLSERIRSHLQL